MPNKVRVNITNVTVNAPTYDNVSFKPSMINFFYGKNGTGKSTLAKAFKDGHAKTDWKGSPFKDENILIYNEEFIEKNIKSYGNIPGVFTISEVNAIKKKEIDDKTIEKNGVDKQVEVSEAALQKIVDDHKAAQDDFIQQILDKTEKIRKRCPETQKGFIKDKDKFLKRLKETTPVSADEDECFSLYDTVYGKGEPPTYDKDFAIVLMPSMPISDLMRVSIVSKSKTDFAGFIRTLGNMDWVTAGHKAYHDTPDGKCPYCQQKLPADFEEQLSRCYDEQYKKDIADLKKFVDQYSTFYNQMKADIEFNIKHPFPTALKDEFKKATLPLIPRIDRNLDLLRRKLDNPSEEIELDDIMPDLKELNENTVNAMNKELADYRAVLDDIPGQKTKCMDMVWGMMASECSTDLDDWSKKVDADNAAWKAKNDEITDLKSKSRDLEKEIALLNTQTVNTTKAMQDINKSIRSAGFRGFELQEKAGAKYVYELVRKNGDKSEVVNQDQKLSEGERHFIAFLYFYHLVMGSQSDDGKAHDKIVIIDDPVSSMDSGSLFIVASLVREMISICYNNYEMDSETADKHIKQFFCMTHNPYFFREITYNRLPDYEVVSFFEIKKNGDNETSIEECDEDDTLTGGGKINRSPVRNTYDSYWHEYMTTESSETLMMVIRQILDYYFVQMVGYKGGNLRRDLLDKNEKEFVKDGDKTDYTIASAMISMINTDATGFNDGLYYDSSAADCDHLRAVFERIFRVLRQEQHYNMMTRRAR